MNYKSFGFKTKAEATKFAKSLIVEKQYTLVLVTWKGNKPNWIDNGCHLQSLPWEVLYG